MPSILPPAPEKQDEDSLSVLHELAPPCEYSHHGRFGPGPVAWIAWYEADCCAPSRVRLFCDPCWRARGRSGRVRCRHCWADLGAPMDRILRLERL